MLTVVIPTLNRPIDLLKAIESICCQTRLPDEMIIVDQSVNNSSISAVKRAMSFYESVKLQYIHDASILGLVDAKRVSVLHASGDIICFLEDDVVLERDYLKCIELGFIKNKVMIGCSGFITNQPNSSVIYRVLFQVFHRGIFRDPRMSIKVAYTGYDNKLIPSNMLSGGVSAWRREVFDQIPFDVQNGFHMLEDVDFSTRVQHHFGNRLFINPNARLAHYFSPVGRRTLGARQRTKLRECFTYYKKRRDWNWATISFLWLLSGMFFEATSQSIKSRSLGPIIGYFMGVVDGINKKTS